MTFDQFVSLNAGKKLDWDGQFGGQCVDLFRFYVNKVLELPQPKGVIGAADFWTNYEIDPVLRNNFTKHPNTPTGKPEKGDVVIWNKNAGGGFGHIGVCFSSTVSSFISFDQNWRAINVCELTDHNYTNVLGWLRGKGADMADELQTYFGATDNSGVKSRSKEHLGEHEGKCDWGNEAEGRGGFLGSARREIKDLRTQLQKQKELYSKLEEDSREDREFTVATWAILQKHEITSLEELDETLTGSQPSPTLPLGDDIIRVLKRIKAEL